MVRRLNIRRTNSIRLAFYLIDIFKLLSKQRVNKWKGEVPICINRFFFFFFWKKCINRLPYVFYILYHAWYRRESVSRQFMEEILQLNMCFVLYETQLKHVYVSVMCKLSWMATTYANKTVGKYSRKSTSRYITAFPGGWFLVVKTRSVVLCPPSQQSTLQSPKIMPKVNKNLVLLCDN